MKNLNIIAAALASTVAFASPVFAGWTEASKSVDGDTWYIDYGTVKENNGYVYYWDLDDLLKPDSEGDLSYKALNEVDCGTPRKFRYLSVSYYTQPMASGSVSSSSNNASGWYYLKPNNVSGIMINETCDYAGK